MFTGSDDCLIKVWDRRALGGSNHATSMGAFLGHTEGVTNIASKGDGVYLASNGKDCLLKVWDLRKMNSNIDLRANPIVRCPNFDYRWHQYPLKYRQ